MEEYLVICNTPSADELWAGIGGHFDSLGQVLNEFVDNSISNFVGHTTDSRDVIITIRKIDDCDNVNIVIEDTGTGINDLDAAFTLGNTSAGETPLNEHGFGLKHALASADPQNDAWQIVTRTKEDVQNNKYKKISAPYKICGFKCEMIDSTVEPWPGSRAGTGTIISFVCTWNMYKTLARGLKGNFTSLVSFADVLCEDLGFTYAGIIKESKANIYLRIAQGGEIKTYPVGAVEPDWDNFFDPGKNSVKVDLGNGDILIDHAFGIINDKRQREPFDNTTTRKYYKQSMSSSGVEIRINGRMICNNLFQEIWGLEKHNSYNSLLITLDLKASDSEKLPVTRTSKNGLREGDPRLERLYEWIRNYVSQPQKDVALSNHETDLFEELAKRYQKYVPDPKVVDTEKHVFTSINENIRIDMYLCYGDNVILYEGKKENTSFKDVYQLRMYWDGCVCDGIRPTKAVLIAKNHPKTVLDIIDVINSMTDARGDHYAFVAKTWEDEGLKI